MAASRSRWLKLGIPTLALVVLAAVVVIILTRNGSSGPDWGEPRGIRVVRGGPAVRLSRPPDSYRIVYRVEERLADKVQVSTEERWVRRPFESRTETRAGEPPGGKKDAVRISAFGRTGIGDANEDGVAFVSPPAVAADDVRLDVALDESLERGLLERRGRRQVLRRRCQVYRSRGSLTIELERPTEDDHADSCVDEAGLVLAETVVAEGRLRSRRVAIEVEEEPAIADAPFRTGRSEIPVDQGGGLVRELRPDSRPPGDFWQLDEVPDGFEPFGRFTVIPAQPENFTDPTRTGNRRASVADIWRRGPDVLIVDQGGTLHGVSPFEIDKKNPTVNVGELGKAELRLGGRVIELRTLLKGGRYVTVSGTLPLEQLTAVARALHKVPGGELVFKD